MPATPPSEPPAGQGETPTSAEEHAVAREATAFAALAPWFQGNAPGTLWVAFSGGVDSTVLLHVLRGLPNVAAIHVDHGLHEDSRTWARCCAATARAWGVPCRVRSVAVARGGNLEAEARRVRYDVWQQLLEPGDVLALAHHANDQAETRLWQLLTGRETGGMPTERALGKGRLVRPMLNLGRCAIVQYAKRQGLRWIEDPANADLRSDRNFIRHRLAPSIERHFPRTFARLAAPRPNAARTLPPLPAANASEERVADWLAAAGLPLAQRRIREIARQSGASPSRLPRIAMAPGIDAWRYRRHWHLVRRQAEANALGHPSELAVGTCVALPGGTLRWRPDAIGLVAGSPLAARPRRGGERLRLHGRGSKAVKALFQEHGIAPWQRGDWPLLYDAAGRLVAVPGLGIGAEFATPGGLAPRWTPRAATLTTA